jgi:hypothetical protein
MEQPARQLAALHTSPTAQLVPFGTAVQAAVLAPGWQLWQAFPGFAVPDGYTVPPMSHCVPHAPPAQT